tara:strand:- start:2275 stop:2793 length:519 start_codon:yes stop_codon:yes gene_type:complete
MAGELAFVKKITIDSSSPVSFVNVDGIDTDDAYFVTWRNVQATTDNVAFRGRVIVSGSEDSGTNYNRAYKTLKAYATNTNDLQNGQGEWFIGQIGTPAHEQSNGYAYLYNFSSGSERAFGILHSADFNSISKVSGNVGGIEHTATGNARTAFRFYVSSGNMDKGEFCLYKVR